MMTVSSFVFCPVVEFHLSWSGPCDCVKPMLYRVSLEKEEIKFVTAAADQVHTRDHTDQGSDMSSCFPVQGA